MYQSISRNIFEFELSTYIFLKQLVRNNSLPLQLMFGFKFFTVHFKIQNTQISSNDDKYLYLESFWIKHSMTVGIDLFDWCNFVLFLLGWHVCFVYILFLLISCTKLRTCFGYQTEVYKLSAKTPNIFPKVFCEIW